VSVFNEASLGMLLEDLRNQVLERMKRKESFHFMVIYDADRDTLSLPINMGIPENAVRIFGSKWKVKNFKKEA
jgi:hypothetical protein